MPPIDLRNPGRPIRVGVVMLRSVTEHLDIAPAAFFSSISREFLKDVPSYMLSDELKAQAHDFTFHWVTEDGSIPSLSTPGQLTENLRVVPTDSFASCPPLDIAVLGASKAGHEASETEKAFLRKVHDDCAAFLCICAGFEPVLSAGLLEGKSATAPQLMLPMAREMAPGVEWVEKRWWRDGKIRTSGALLNVLDLVAAFGRETWGGEGTLVDYIVPIGAWPERDVDYKDSGPVEASSQS